ncbi:hypothetical protein ACG7TL_008959 [Trametes sanguinea]
MGPKADDVRGKVGAEAEWKSPDRTSRHRRPPPSRPEDGGAASCAFVNKTDLLKFHALEEALQSGQHNDRGDKGERGENMGKRSCERGCFHYKKGGGPPA